LAPGAPASNDLDLDAKVLANFIYALNISRRHFVTYPGDHPIIASASGKALDLLNQLLAPGGEITLGIGRNTLFLGDAELDENDPVFRDLAQDLSRQGAAALVFRPGLGAEDLGRFHRIMGMSREQVQEQGGIEQVAAGAGLEHLVIKGVDYGAFGAAEGAQGQQEDLWGRFIRALMAGDVKGEGEPEGIEDPRALARVMNEGEDFLPGGSAAAYDETIATFLRELGDEGMEEGERAEALEKMSALADGLNPGLRKQLLGSAFNSLASRRGVAEGVLGRLPQKTILEVLEDVNLQRATVPTAILKLLERFARLGEGASGTPAAPGGRDEERERMLGDVLGQDTSGNYVPEAYRDKLESLVGLNRLPPAQREGVEMLKESLEPHRVEVQAAAVTVEVLRSLGTDEDSEGLKDGLAEHVDYLLEMGDFLALAELHERLGGAGWAAGGLQPRDDLLASFARSAFLEKVLAGLSVWGKSKSPDIRALILRVGSPFAEPLLDLLAEEADRSRRRYVLDCLQKLGAAARPAALLRLSDARWYVVRNLVLLLRNLGDPGVAPYLHRLIHHPHARVRQEVFKALLHLGDPRMEQLLLKGLDSPDPDERLQFMQSAEKSRSPQVLEKLLAILGRASVVDFEFELKCGAVHALAGIGSAEAIPELERLLESRPLLHRRQLHRLKVEIVGSLDRYPAGEARGMLERLAKVGGNELSELAEAALARI